MASQQKTSVSMSDNGHCDDQKQTKQQRQKMKISRINEFGFRKKMLIIFIVNDRGQLNQVAMSAY